MLKKKQVSAVAEAQLTKSWAWGQQSCVVDTLTLRSSFCGHVFKEYGPPLGELSEDNLFEGAFHLKCWPLQTLI